MAGVVGGGGVSVTDLGARLCVDVYHAREHVRQRLAAPYGRRPTVGGGRIRGNLNPATI